LYFVSSCAEQMVLVNSEKYAKTIVLSKWFW
jgi:hypothetical protein